MTRTPPPPRSRRADADLRTALDALLRAAQHRLHQHPQGHLARDGRPATIELALALPVASEPGSPTADEAVEIAARRLDDEIGALLAERAASAPGRVWCLRCSRADCEHGVPAGPRAVFAGYGPTGVPQFEDFAQWLLGRQDERVDRLYAESGARARLVTVEVSGRELAADLLPAFRRGTGPEVRIHGQVVAGWFPLRGENGENGQAAVSLQVVSARADAGRHRRLSLSVVGAAPDGSPLERVGTVPWAAVARWGQRVLDAIEDAQNRLEPAQLSARIEGVLGSIARRLEQGRRAEERRTRHAEDRHRGGDRPTRMAAADLERAGADRILKDTLRDTWIVLGERGRAHVFGERGRLVTSLRETPDGIAKKRARGRWRPATEDEIATLRAASSETEDADDDGS